MKNTTMNQANQSTIFLEKWQNKAFFPWKSGRNTIFLYWKSGKSMQKRKISSYI